MLRGLSLLGFVSLLVIPSAPLARADDFSFSFTNTQGNVPGTVTGIIRGLTNNSTGPATQVIITSFPAGLNSVLGGAPINAALWDQQVQNSFTESNGVVTAGGFYAQQTVGEVNDGAQLYVNGSDGPYNFLNLDGEDTLFVYSDNGLHAANIQPLGNSVPTLSKWAMLLMALLLGSSGLLLLNKYRATT